MLGKLIKYDLKANRNLFLLMYGILLASALGTRVVISDVVQELEGYSNVGLVAAFLMMSYMVALVTVSTMGYVLVIRRFYHNLFGSEGYLSFTLPVTAAQHFIAKTLSGLIWLFGSMMVQIISLLILFSGVFSRDMFGENMDMLIELYEPMINGQDLILQLVLAILNSVVSLMMIYFAVCLGQMARRRRILTAVICYFGMSFIFSMIEGVVTEAFITMDIYALESLIHYDVGYYLMNVLLVVLKMIIFGGGSILIMQKKLNLE
ncbi:MAG: hypothetical protein IJZ85_04180 [Lachnospiraceae bacterium]|nr:hypothetical protein [Lachnospiraceae bacterium]